MGAPYVAIGCAASCAAYVIGAGAAIGAVYVCMGSAAIGAAYVTGAAMGIDAGAVYAMNSCGLMKPLLSVSSWVNKLVDAAGAIAIGAA